MKPSQPAIARVVSTAVLFLCLNLAAPAWADTCLRPRETPPHSLTNTASGTGSRFFAPLNNPPTTNRGPAGRTFPVKFTLHDASGGFIGDPAAIISVDIVPAVCGTQAADVVGEEATVDTGGLKYDPLTGVWHFNWQTTRSQGGCWVLEVHLADGSVHAVVFELR